MKALSFSPWVNGRFSDILLQLFTLSCTNVNVNQQPGIEHDNWVLSGEGKSNSVLNESNTRAEKSDKARSRTLFSIPVLQG